jgi:hypothetical protein
VSNSNILITVQLENIVYKLLKKKCLHLVNFEYSYRRLYLDVYNLPSFDILYKKQIILSYITGVSFKNLIYNFGICETYIFWFLKKGVGLKYIPFTPLLSTISLSVGNILFFKYQLKVFKYYLSFFFNILKQQFILKSLKVLFNFFSINFFSIKKFTKNYSKKLHFINGLLCFRSIMLKISNILF